MSVSSPLPPCLAQLFHGSLLLALLRPRHARRVLGICCRSPGHRAHSHHSLRDVGGYEGQVDPEPRRDVKANCCTPPCQGGSASFVRTACRLMLAGNPVRADPTAMTEGRASMACACALQASSKSVRCACSRVLRVQMPHAPSTVRTVRAAGKRSLRLPPPRPLQCVVQRRANLRPSARMLRHASTPTCCAPPRRTSASALTCCAPARKTKSRSGPPRLKNSGKPSWILQRQALWPRCSRPLQPSAGTLPALPPLRRCPNRRMRSEARLPISPGGISTSVMSQTSANSADCTAGSLTTPRRDGLCLTRSGSRCCGGRRKSPSAITCSSCTPFGRSLCSRSSGAWADVQLLQSESLRASTRSA